MRIAESAGSACTSISVAPRLFIRALGVVDRLAGTSVRIGIGHFNVETHGKAAARTIVETISVDGHGPGGHRLAGSRPQDISCKEKIKVLNENLTELREVIRGPFEDTILLGRAPKHYRLFVRRLVDSNEEP